MSFLFNLNVHRTDYAHNNDPISKHNAQIRLQGTQPTTLNLLQQGSTNQSYNLTQTCYTTGGCTVNVTQGN